MWSSKGACLFELVVISGEFYVIHNSIQLFFPSLTIFHFSITFLFCSVALSFIVVVPQILKGELCCHVCMQTPGLNGVCVGETQSNDFTDSPVHGIFTVIVIQKKGQAL